MAHVLIPTNAMFAFCAKSVANESPGAYFRYMALGTGTGQDPEDNTLKAETAIDGLARGDAAAGAKTVKTAVDNDTSELTLAFTSNGADVTITECGSFVNATKDAGNMGLYGTFSSGIPLSKSDKITPTMQCQFKLD